MAGEMGKFMSLGAKPQVEDRALTDSNATITSKSDIPEKVLMQALGDVQRATVQVLPSHSESSERNELRLFILLEYNGIQMMHPMTTAERNFVVRNNPTLLKACLANAQIHAQRQLADQRGSRYLEGCSISWAPSFIPFHLAYTIGRFNHKCEHLGSVRKLKTKDPNQYAEVLVSLAKPFLERPYGSRSPHLPFIWVKAPNSSAEMLDSDLDPEDFRAQRTIEHSQRLATQFKTIADFDIETAEATAKLINENKIIAGLLKLIFEPGPKKLGPPHAERFRSSKAEPQNVKLKNTTPDNKCIDTTKPEEDEPHSTNQTIRDSKVAWPGRTHSREPLAKHVKQRSSVGRVKTDNSKGVVELFKSTNDGAAKKPGGVARYLVSTQEVEGYALKGAKLAAPKTASSERKSTPRGSKSKVARTSPCPPPAGDDPLQVVQAEVFAPSSQSRQDSISQAPQDGETARPSQRSAPLHKPKLSLDTVMSTPYLPSPAYPPFKETKIPKTQSLGSLQKGPSVATSDITNGENLTYSYPPEGDSASTAPVKPIGASSRGTSMENSIVGCGAQGLSWTYFTCTDADEALLKAGIWLWKRPPTYFYPHRLPIKMSDPSVLAPVIVSHESTGSSVPLMEYSGETVHIIPHEERWEDVRSSECHPDFLTPCKLVEYQACEAAGYYIWRHDRDQLPCRKSGCEVMTMDHHPSSIFCLGCGPKTVVRYCSFQHQVQDVANHWAECGHPSLVIQCIIDHATAPRHFSDKPPEVVAIHGMLSAALQRQKTYFMSIGGYYTLFDPVTYEPKTLSWPKTQSNWRELDRRVERLLNIAYLGICSPDVIRYIYRLLSGLLYLARELTDHVEELLETQFREEFDYRGWLDTISDGASCDFRWSTGNTRTEVSVFKEGGMPDVGLQLHITDLQTWVERMENKYWILRAWRQQHPTEKDWRVRANRYGMIPLETGVEIYRLGPGWTGWGGREGNQRDSDLGSERKL